MKVAVLPRRYSRPYGSAPKSRSNELCVAEEDALWPLFRVEMDGCLLAREDGALVS